jgi:CheY-like chemotaxis protein
LQINRRPLGGLGVRWRVLAGGLNANGCGDRLERPALLPEGEEKLGVTGMVVEDDAATRRLLGYVLQTNDFQAILLDNAEDALERLPDEQPDVIVCDADLPGMDGRDFIQVLRSANLAAAPVILLNGNHEQDSADAFLEKPFDPLELAQLVERLSSS